MRASIPLRTVAAIPVEEAESARMQAGFFLPFLCFSGKLRALGPRPAEEMGIALSITDSFGIGGIAAQGGRRLLQDLFVIGDHLDRIVFPRQTRSRAEQALQQGSGDALLLFGSGDLACGCCGKGGNRLVEVEG